MDEEATDPWDDAADSFDEAPDHGLRDPDVRRAWLEVLRSALPPTPARIADLGCGTGTLSILLADAGYRVHGVDSSPRMIEQARAKAAGSEPGPTFEVADVEAVRIEPASVDVVLSRHVLWALREPSLALARWAEMLAPGGRLVLIEGRWDTGAGLAEEDATTMLAAVGRVTERRSLTDPRLWGRAVDDERYLLVGEAATGPTRSST